MGMGMLRRRRILMFRCIMKLGVWCSANEATKRSLKWRVDRICIYSSITARQILIVQTTKVYSCLLSSSMLQGNIESCCMHVYCVPEGECH